MKNLLRFIAFVLMVGSAYAQSVLPACPPSGFFHNCFGTFTYSSGMKYVGEWRDDKYNGQGALFYANGSTRQGIWADGVIIPSATVQPPLVANQVTNILSAQTSFGNLPVCQGNDVSKWSNCFGTKTDPSGTKYVGEFKGGKRNGQGTYIFANGNKYVGEWMEDKYNGLGAIYSSTGTAILEGIWSEDRFVRSAPVQQASVSNQIAPLVAVQPDNAERNKLLAEVEAERKKRQELEEQLRLARLQSQVSPPSSMTTMANRKALVIGNDTYKSVSKLLNAREDAKAIASNLTAVGYKVTLQLDLNEKEMKAALRTFSSQVQGGDEVMFFFAGHGVQLGATNYLLPTDIGGESEAQVKDEAIQLQRVLDDMTEKKAKFTLAMIDACRDNPFKSMGRNIGGRGLAPTTAATGQMVVFSAGSGQQALDRLGSTDKNKNGVFTRTFLKEMQKSGVSIDRIVKNVRNEVAELAKTIGHEQVPAIYDQVLGDFYFKK